MLSIAGKVALVTGAGSVGPGWGNGKATATLLARRGASVFGVDIVEDAAAETQRIITDEGGTCVSDDPLRLGGGVFDDVDPEDGGPPAGEQGRRRLAVAPPGPDRAGSGHEGHL